MSDEKKTPGPRTRKAPRRTARDEGERPASPPPRRPSRARPPGSAPTPEAPEVPPGAPGEQSPPTPSGRPKPAARSRPRGATQRPEAAAAASAAVEPASPAAPPEGGKHPSSGERVLSVSRLTDDDLHLFGEGRHFRLWEKLGAHPGEAEGVAGTHFAVWAPSAREVSVVGEWNGWNPGEHRLAPRGSSGIWEGFLPGVGKGALYKYHLRSHHGGYEVAKADPFAFRSETPPRTASIVWDLDYAWGDEEWMGRRGEAQGLEAPVSTYELHPGSWRRGEGGRHLGWRELAPRLADHVEACGFTHVELLPVMEHPFYGSWGYQTTGYFAPTGRYGEPQDLMAFVDHLHGRGIGVLLDWVPSHFPIDDHALGYFDGTHLYEHADPRKGFHPDWGSYIFDYGRNEVRSFLVSSALFWLERYHADGLRVDAVASMLYLDYSRKEGEWIPNEHGGRENLEAVRFLKELNEEVYRTRPGAQTVAEESTAWPGVSRPTSGGGLGFGYKWDMGWMHDTLAYFREDPVHRKYHHDKLTFRRLYAYAENFVLSLSHDEVVHGKGSLLGKMPGDEWQRFANLRLLLASMIAQPGKKLLFMGAELAQWREWDHESQLDWHLVEAGEGEDLPAEGRHAGVLRLVGDLNRLYRDEPALHRLDASPEGFEWLDADDRERSTLSFIRRAVPAGEAGEAEAPPVVAVFNFTPVPRENFRLGVPSGGRWREVLNTDAEVYGGSGVGNLGGVESHPVPLHGQRRSVTLTLPPLGGVFLRRE